EFMKLNNTETKSKCKAYYFYKYFKVYLTAATKNDEIIQLSEQQTIQKLTSTPINTYHLAHAITYYYIMKQKKFTYYQILQYYKSNTLPKAEKIIKNKFQINFTIPQILDTTLFFNSNIVVNTNIKPDSEQLDKPFLPKQTYA
ncbi:15480_t:CDS:1, partial [Gigaspora margarita]